MWDVVLWESASQLQLPSLKTKHAELMALAKDFLDEFGTISSSLAIAATKRDATADKCDSALTRERLMPRLIEQSDRDGSIPIGGLLMEECIHVETLEEYPFFAPDNTSQISSNWIQDRYPLSDLDGHCKFGVLFERLTSATTSGDDANIDNLDNDDPSLDFTPASRDQVIHLENIPTDEVAGWSQERRNIATVFIAQFQNFMQTFFDWALKSPHRQPLHELFFMSDCTPFMNIIPMQYSAVVMALEDPSAVLHGAKILTNTSTIDAKNNKRMIDLFKSDHSRALLAHKLLPSLASFSRQQNILIDRGKTGFAGTSRQYQLLQWFKIFTSLPGSNTDGEAEELHDPHLQSRFYTTIRGLMTSGFG